MRKEQQMPVFIDIKQLKEALGIRKDITIYNYIKKGMPSYLIGNRRKFVLEEVLQWFKGRKK